jgi:predicted DNA-binding transcriptional regulator AlpA
MDRPESYQRALDALRAGQSVAEAAAAAGLSRAAIYKRRATDPELAAAMKGPERLTTQDALAKAVGVSVSAVQRWGREGLPRPPAGWVEADVRQWLAERGRVEPGKRGPPRRALVAAGAAMAEARAGGASAEPAAVDAPAADAAAGPPGRGEAPPTAGDSVPELLRKEALGKAQREWWRAKLDRLKALREEGVLVDKAALVEQVRGSIVAARTKLLALPGALCQALAAEPDPRRCEELLSERLRAVLHELGRSSEQAMGTGAA